MNKTPHTFLTIVSCLTLSLSAFPTTYAKTNHVLAPHLQPASTNNLREQVQVIAYQTTGAQSMISTTTRDYGNAKAWQGSAVRLQKKVVDALTGRTLVQYHGKRNQDELISQYDAIGRVTLTTNIEHGLHDSHITHQQTTYSTKQGVTTVAIAQLDNKNSDGTAYTTYTDYNAEQQKISQWDNMPEHNGKFFNENEPQPAVSYHYNDLGQLTTTTNLPRVAGDNTQPRFNTQEQREYDAQGRVTKKILRQSIPVGIEGKDNQQKTTAFSRYDDVANSTTTYQSGQFIHVDNAGRETEPSTPIISALKTQLMNDQKKVITEKIAGNDGVINHLSYDNFAEKTGQSTQGNQTTNNADTIRLQSALTHDALGRVNCAVMGSGNDKITVKFDHDDFGKTASSKTVNGIRRYHYLTDSSGAIVAEARGDVTPDVEGNLPNARVQTYTYSDNGYTVVQHGWQGGGVNSQVSTTNQYGDVNNKRKLLSQTINDGTGKITQVTYDYDYATGEEIHREKTTPEGNFSTEDRSYRADGKPLSVSFDKQSNGDAKTIRYQYVDANMPQAKNLDIDKLASQTDIAGLTQQYQYEGKSVRTTTLYNQTDEPLASITNTIDGLGQILQRQRKKGTDTVIDTLIYQHDDLQRVKQINYQDRTTVSGQPVTGQIQYTYQNTTNNVIKKVETPVLLGSDEQITTAYSYDLSSDQLKQSTVTKRAGDGSFSPNPTVTRYTRDALGNVIHISKTGAKSSEQDVAYYDDNGNANSGNTLDRYRGIIGDNNNAISYDAQGNVLSDDSFNHYTWNNATNQEKTYTDKQGNVTTYAYPIYGRSKSQVFHHADGSIARTTLRSYYLAGKIQGTQEYQGENSGYLSVYLNNDIRLVVALAKNGQVDVKQLQFLQHDKTGTVENTLTIDANGKITGTRYQYGDDGAQESTGQTVSNKLSIFYQPLTFNGDYHDQETGLTGTDYKLARTLKHYQSGIAQFLSADYGRKLMNRRLLDNGNAVSYRDAGGHMADKEIVTIISGVSTALGFLGGIGACRNFSRTDLCFSNTMLRLNLVGFGLAAFGLVVALSGHVDRTPLGTAGQAAALFSIMLTLPCFLYTAGVEASLIMVRSEEAAITVAEPGEFKLTSAAEIQDSIGGKDVLNIIKGYQYDNEEINRQLQEFLAPRTDRESRRRTLASWGVNIERLDT